MHFGRKNEETNKRNTQGIHVVAKPTASMCNLRKYLRAMTTLLENGFPASYVMDAAKRPW